MTAGVVGRLRLPLPLAILALALAYYAAARLGLLLAFEDSNASPVWPPSGIALAALALFGARLLPGVALGAFAANAVVFAANDAAGWPTIAAASLAITVGNSLEAWLGARLLARWVGTRSPFERLADVAKFIVVAAVASGASASIGIATLVLAGIAPSSAAPTIALTWWVGDATGMLILAPLLMLLMDGAARAWGRRDGLLALLLAAVVLALGAAVFGDALADRRLAWLFMPCIAWAAFRHGPGGVASASLLIAGMAVWATTRGLGPFARGPLNDALIVLQTFVGLTAITGLVLAADRRERQRLGVRRALRRDVALPWVVLLGALGVTVIGWHVVASGSERRAQERFAYVGTDIRDRLLARMAAKEQVLRGAAGLFAASQQVDRTEWKAYVDRLELPRQFPGIQALGFARHLAPGDREAFETAVREEGHEDFAIRPDRPAHEAATSIVYIEPFDPRNRRAFGYDMSTEPVRRAAMDRARDSGMPALSGKVTLMQENGADVQAGVLLYLPVYRNGQPVGTVAERRAALLGYVYSPFRMGNLMRAALGPVADVEGLAVRLYSGGDARAVSDAALLFAGGVDRRAATPLFRSREVVEIAGQPWTLALDTLPRFEATVDVQKAQIVLVAGVGLSLLLFGLVRSLTMTRERAELLADDMTVALRASEAKFRSLAESAGEAIVIADAQGLIVSWNRAASAIFGHDEEAVMGQDMALLMPERFRAAHRAGLARLAKGGESQLLGRSLQLTGLHARGHEFPIELSLASWETPGGGRYFSGIIRDITARERAAEALRHSERAARAAERELQAVLRASPLGVVFTDADGTLRYANPSFLRIAGQPLEVLRGSGWRRALHPEDYERVRNEWAAAVAARASYEGEFRYLHADGRIVWARALGGPIVEDGVTLGFVATVEDVSARVAAAAEIAVKNEALLRSNAELAQFAYVASHDLKEPLRTVASYSQLLLRRHRERLDQEGREFLDYIGEGAKRAQALIADLLELARLDTAARPLAPVKLAHVFEHVRQQLTAAIGDAQAEITHDALPVVLGDRGQLVQLLQNLIGNAIKFRRPGQPPRIHVGAERLDGGTWRISVTDNGIGIDARFHDKIFTLFQRLHRADYPGTGIGLAICKKVAEHHGGRIGVASVPGQGSTFFFTIAAGDRAEDQPLGVLHRQP